MTILAVYVAGQAGYLRLTVEGQRSRLSPRQERETSSASCLSRLAFSFSLAVVGSGVILLVGRRGHEFVAGTRERPEVGVFVQAHAGRPPFRFAALSNDLAGFVE